MNRTTPGSRKSNNITWKISKQKPLRFRGPDGGYYRIYGIAGGMIRVVGPKGTRAIKQGKA